MLFPEFDEEMRFRSVWESVQIARTVEYSLFPFGASDLPYYLICEPDQPGGMVSVQKGDVNIARPLILTPGNSHPEFEDFFQDSDGQQFIEFLLSRTAAFSNLKSLAINMKTWLKSRLLISSKKFFENLIL